MQGGWCGQPLDARPPLAAKPTMDDTPSPTGSVTVTATGASGAASSTWNGDPSASKTTSARAQSPRSTATSSAFPGSMTTLFLLVLRARNATLPRVDSPEPGTRGRRRRARAPSGGSTRSTSAPRPAQTSPAYSVSGWANSTTLKPASRPFDIACAPPNGDPRKVAGCRAGRDSARPDTVRPKQVLERVWAGAAPGRLPCTRSAWREVAGECPTGGTVRAGRPRRGRRRAPRALRGSRGGDREVPRRHPGRSEHLVWKLCAGPRHRAAAPRAGALERAPVAARP